VATFTDELFIEISDSYRAILNHPFLHGLLDGTLPAAAFAHYVVQDAHYLRDYARALAIVGAKATDEAAIVRFCSDAAEAITVERSLHAGLLTELGVQDDVVQPATVAYTSYLLRTAYQGSYAEAVAAVLPCYWIYALVGAELLAAPPSPNPQYRRWIETYGGPEFQAVVAAVLDTVNELGPTLSSAERARFVGHVITTTRYEWMFWDAAWRLERWPEELN